MFAGSLERLRDEEERPVTYPGTPRNLRAPASAVRLLSVDLQGFAASARSSRRSRADTGVPVPDSAKEVRSTGDLTCIRRLTTQQTVLLSWDGSGTVVHRAGRAVDEWRRARVKGHSEAIIQLNKEDFDLEETCGKYCK